MAEEKIRRTLTQPGPVISKATIQLHTRIAVDLFHGQRGFTWFAANLNKLWDLSLQDDPYADHRLILIEEQLPLLKQFLGHKVEEIGSLLGALSDVGIQPVSNQSVRPVNVPLACRATQAAAAVLQLAVLDQLAQRALLARHFGLLTDTDWQRCVREPVSAMRDLFALSGYKASDACRDDFAGNNARAQAARERLGEVPPEILMGLKLPTMGPMRTKGAPGY